MKHLLTLFALAVLLCGGGCANEGPTGEEVQEQFARGVRGEGQVMPEIDRSGDPYVRPREPAPPLRPPGAVR